MVAGKEYGLELGAVKRATRQFLDPGAVGQYEPVAHIRVGEAAIAERLDFLVVLEPRNRKALAAGKRISAD